MSELDDRLPTEFARQVLMGSLRVLDDAENPIRLNLFAAGIRELFGYLLHHYAPDEEVRACDWFVQAPDTKTVTRRQRATYAAQGGFSDEYIAGLEVEVEDIHSRAIKSINELSKYTHVRPGQLVTDEKLIGTFVKEAVEALDDLLSSFTHCRETVLQALQDNICDAGMLAFMQETFETIDFLAGKGYEVNPFIDDEEFQVTGILADKIKLKYSGVAPVTLHYGSKDDAAQISHDFPFWMTFEAPIKTPTSLSLVAHHFDDSSWFE